MNEHARYRVSIDIAAEADLHDIAEYLIEQGAEAAARKLVGQVLDRIASFETLPLRGSIPREVEGASVRGFRQTLIAPYRIVYRVQEDQVIVVVIADGRRDMRALLTERLLRL